MHTAGNKVFVTYPLFSKKHKWYQGTRHNNKNRNRQHVKEVGVQRTVSVQ